MSEVLFFLSSVMMVGFGFLGGYLFGLWHADKEFRQGSGEMPVPPRPGQPRPLSESTDEFSLPKFLRLHEAKPINLNHERAKARIRKLWGNPGVRKF